MWLNTFRKNFILDIWLSFKNATGKVMRKEIKQHTSNKVIRHKIKV